MANFKRVDKEPENLKANECVIFKPDFQEMIEKTRKRRGKSGLTTVTALRDIFMAITDKYDHAVNPYHLKLSKYQGIAFENDDDIRQIVFKIINDHDLALLEKAVEFEAKNRPTKTDFIYYVSPDLDGTAAFIKLGINQVVKNNKKVKVNE